MKRGAAGARERIPSPSPGRRRALLALASARVAAFALLAGWPQLQELHNAAASNFTSCHDRRRHAASSLAACARA
jgi:hypothetical protein